MDVLAIPVFDGFAISSFDDLIEVIGKLEGLPITIMNDFDVPWVQQANIKMARVPKKKAQVVRVNEDEDDEENDEEKEDDEEDEEEE